MKMTACALLAISILGLGLTQTKADPIVYDSYAIRYENPVYTGRDVTAVAVDFVNSHFRHRRVAGPGVIYHRSFYWYW
jgi:hypothetical protein